MILLPVFKKPIRFAITVPVSFHAQYPRRTRLWAGYAEAPQSTLRT